MQAGRFVSVTLAGCSTLNIAEVQVFVWDVTPATGVQLP